MAENKLNKLPIVIFSLVILLLIGLILTKSSPTGLITHSSEKNTIDNTINIGIILPLTGNLAYTGQDALNGINIALNECPIELRKKINIFIEDSQGDTTSSLNAAQKLININKIKILIGTISSTNALSIAPIAEQNKLIFLVPISTNPQINKAGDYIFKFREDGSLQGLKLAEFSLDRGFQNVGIIYDDSSSALISFKDSFEKEFIKHNGNIDFTLSYSSEDADFRTQLTKIKSTKPDAVLVGAYPVDIAKILKQAKELNIDTQFLGGSILETQKLFELAGDSAEGIIITSQTFGCDNNPVASSFCNKYRKLYNNEPLYYSAYAYDTTKVLLDILQKSNSFDTEKIKEDLYKVSGYSGLTGDITLDSEGNVQSKDFLIKQVHNKQFVLYGE